MTIAIEKNVPITRATQSGPGAERYPWNDMEVGDSFPVPNDVKINSFRRLATMHRDKRFSVLKQDDGSYRCWRIA